MVYVHAHTTDELLYIWCSVGVKEENGVGLKYVTSAFGYE